MIQSSREKIGNYRRSETDSRFNGELEVVK